MTSADALFESSIPGLPLIGRGKVRDIYSVDSKHLLIVATDRLSAFDVVLPDPVPGKGRVLTAISGFWFRRMADIVPNHLTAMEPGDVVEEPEALASLEGRAVVVKRLKPLPIEAVVRGYLAGSGWRDYRDTGRVCGIELPPGLEQSQKLPATLFTPSSKAPAGRHDENMSFADVEALIGTRLASGVRDAALAIYERASSWARSRGIIVADTKFEFGVDDEGRLVLIDELLTPDSSRFWPVDGYATGTSPPSFDKQYVRDYLETLDWDKTAPGPALPRAVIDRTAEKYAEALTRLTAP